jgi:hypothetical protein
MAFFHDEPPFAIVWKIVGAKVELRYASCPFCQNMLASIF